MTLFWYRVCVWTAIVTACLLFWLVVALLVVTVAASSEGPGASPGFPPTLRGAPQTSQPAAVQSGGVPQPISEIGTALVGGVVTWFPASGFQAAVPWWRFGQDRVSARVCSDKACVVVVVTGFCACGDRVRPTIADLSPAAFRKLAPLSRGVVRATMEWPIEPLPNTSTEGP